MNYVKIINKSKESVIAERAEMADTTMTRFAGLMGRAGLEKGAGLVIYPNNSIHMFFMRFPLDVLHVAKDGTVVKILHGIKPWRIGPIVGKSKYTVELPVGAVEDSRTAVGDIIELQEIK
jgi:uncharacterized protein